MTGIYPEIYDYENPTEAKKAVQGIKDLYALHVAAREAGDGNETHRISGLIRDAVRRLPRRTVNFKKGRDALIAWLSERYVSDFARQKRNALKRIKADGAADKWRNVMGSAESIGRAKVKKMLAERLINTMSYKAAAHDFVGLKIIVKAFIEEHIDLILDGEAHAYVENSAEPTTDTDFIDFVRREIYGRIVAWSNGSPDADPANTRKFLPTKLHDIIDR